MQPLGIDMQHVKQACKILYIDVQYMKLECKDIIYECAVYKATV